MKIYSNLFGFVANCVTKYSAAELVIKLNLKHSTLKALCLFCVIASIIDFKPLSLILLCPIYKN